MEIIYIDSLFFINLLTDYLLCLCAGRICGLRLKRLRYFLAAFLGALYSVLIFVPGFYFLSSPIMKLCTGLSMALIAYAGEKQPLRCAAVFLSVSAAFGGALWAIGLAGGTDSALSRISIKLLLSAFTVFYSLGCLIFRYRIKSAEQKTVLSRLSFLGKTAEFMTLLDTGNSLSDPISGCGIMVVCPHALKPVLCEHTVLFEELSPIELLEFSRSIPQLKGKLRLIPYSSLGAQGLLPVFRPEGLIVDGRENRELLIAVSKNASGDGFEALL